MYQVSKLISLYKDLMKIFLAMDTLGIEKGISDLQVKYPDFAATFFAKYSWCH